MSRSPRACAATGRQRVECSRQGSCFDARAQSPEVGVKGEEVAIPTQDSTSPLLWTLEDISQLVSHSGNPTETLTNIVNLIQQRFATDVCSVYLLEQDRANLVLAATVGLRPDSVGRVRMPVTEGLVGL